MIITIDGPAGSGKSTLSVALAKKLDFFCLNSGYLYRAIAYVLKTFYGYSDDTLGALHLQELQEIIDGNQLRYDYKQGAAHLFFRDNDITQFLKKVENGRSAAIIAQNGSVRKVVQQYERKIVENKNAVVEGRACGSKTFFDADLKLYVTASADVRAQRAVEDQASRGNIVTKEQALEHIIARDHADMNRKHDPLIIPQGAIVLDSSSLSQQEILDQAIEYVCKVINKG